MTEELNPVELEQAPVAQEALPEFTPAEPEPPKPAVLNDYYIRCRESEREQLYALAAALGVLVEAEGAHVVPPPHAGAWDEIGQITRADGVVVDPEGNPYWHANLRINADLADIAIALAPDSPEIAAGLADLARWFVVGPDGKATAPKQPERVWL
jgi:hypothetical protein